MADAKPLEQIGTVAPAGKAHIARDRQVREQPVVLGQIARVTVLGAEVNPSLRVKPHFCVQGHVAGPRALQPAHDPQQRGLTGP